MEYAMLTHLAVTANMTDKKDIFLDFLNFILFETKKLNIFIAEDHL